MVFPPKTTLQPSFKPTTVRPYPSAVPTGVRRICLVDWDSSTERLFACSELYKRCYLLTYFSYRKISTISRTRR